MNIIQPNIAISQIYSKISKPERFAFLSTIIVGLITHLFIMTNHLPNSDGILYGFSYQSSSWDISLGRWMIPIMVKYRDSFMLPFIIGMVSIVCLAFVSLLLIKMFDIKQIYSSLITGGIVATFPVVTCYFSIMFCADLYGGFATLLAVMAIFLCNKDKNIISGLIIGIVCVALSLGIYQANIGTAVTLCLMMLLMDLLKNKKSIKQVFIKSLRFLTVGSLGILLYFSLTRGICAYFNIPISEYRGLDQIGFTSIDVILKSIIAAYKLFWDFFFKNTVLFNGSTRKLSYWVLLVIFFIFILLIIIKNKIYLNKPRTVFLIFLVTLLPAACASIVIFTKGGYVNLFMLPGMFLPLVLIIALGDHIIEYENTVAINLISVGNWSIILASTALVIGYSVFANVGYLNMQLMWERSYNISTRIIDRVEQLENYYPSQTPILVVGALSDKNYPITNQRLRDYLIGTSSMQGEYLPYENEASGWISFFYNYLGIQVGQLSTEQINTIYSCEEMLSMPEFPKVGSVKIIDGVAVVKLSNPTQ